MKIRQASWPITEAMEVSKKFGTSESLRKLSDKIFILAYEEPLYSSSSAKKRAQIEFSNSIYLKCIEKDITLIKKDSFL